MEIDVIRTSGDDTVVALWVAGRIRTVAVPRWAVAASLGLSGAAATAMSDHDCREFVRKRLGAVAAAADDKLSGSDPDADWVTLDAALLRRHDRQRVI